MSEMNTKAMYKLSYGLFADYPKANYSIAENDIPYTSCTYEYYQNNVKPKPEAVAKTPSGETIWRCRICGYEYVGEEVPDDFNDKNGICTKE